MNKFTKKILETIRKEGLIKEGDSVVAGFSGGADSLCLLLVLWELKPLLKCSIKAVHVNHCLRGTEALRDQEFCRAVCEERGIPFEAVSVDVNGLVEKEGLSVEEAARKLRYEALSAKAGEGLIAAAHHADDQAETILLNMVRGTGLKGLKGMSYKRDNIIRPLLSARREEIEAYLKEKGLSWMTDSTNLSEDYSRNKMRLTVLPCLKEINEGASRNILRAGAVCGEAHEYIKMQAEAWLLRNASGGIYENEIHLNRKLLKEEMPILQRYVIISVLERLGVPLKDWGELHIEALREILYNGNGAHLDLPLGVKADNVKSFTVIKGQQYGKEVQDRNTYLRGRA